MHARRTILSVILAVMAVPTLAQHTFDIRPFLLEGDPAPGSGASFQTFDRPNISESGHVLFAGDTDGPTNADDVVYLDTTLIAQEGSVAPGTGGRYVSFEFFEGAHQINPEGFGAYIANLRDVNQGGLRALYLNNVLVAQSEMPAPGSGGANFQDFGFPGVTDRGMVGFLADLDSSVSTDSVIYLDGLIRYRQGDTIIGGGVFDGNRWDGDFDEVQFNGKGHYVFEGNTDAASNDQGLFGDFGNGLELLIREGASLPARDGEDFLDLFLQTALAENDRWVMRGNLRIAPSNADAVIITPEGLYAQEGAEVVEMPGVFTGNYNAVNNNSLGDVIYLADLAGDTPPGVDEGLFFNGELVITDGVQAPGLPDGILLTDIGFEDMYINDAREIVFVANYTGGDGLFTIRVRDVVDCTKINKHKVRCNANGKLSAKVKTRLQQGTVLTMTHNGADPQLLVIKGNGKGKVKWKRQAGPQEVCIEECDAGFCRTTDCP